MPLLLDPTAAPTPAVPAMAETTAAAPTERGQPAPPGLTLTFLVIALIVGVCIHIAWKNAAAGNAILVGAGVAAILCSLLLRV